MSPFPLPLVLPLPLPYLKHSLRCYFHFFGLAVLHCFRGAAAVVVHVVLVCVVQQSASLPVVKLELVVERELIRSLWLMLPQ